MRKEAKPARSRWSERHLLESMRERESKTSMGRADRHVIPSLWISIKVLSRGGTCLPRSSLPPLLPLFPPLSRTACCSPLGYTDEHCRVFHLSYVAVESTTSEQQLRVWPLRCSVTGAWYTTDSSHQTQLMADTHTHKHKLKRSD